MGGITETDSCCVHANGDIFSSKDAYNYVHDRMHCCVRESDNVRSDCHSRKLQNVSFIHEFCALLDIMFIFVVKM